MGFLENIREKSTPKIRKIIYFSFALIATIIGWILFFVPFCSFFVTSNYIEVSESVSPYFIFSLIDQERSVDSTLGLVGLIAFGFWFIFTVFSTITLIKMIFRLNAGQEKMRKLAKRSLRLNTIFTGLYFVGSFLFCLVYNIFIDDYFDKASFSGNYVTFILVIILDLLFAITLGILDEEEADKRKKLKLKSKKGVTLKKLVFKKIELFIFTTLLLACCIVGFLSTIVSVEYTGESPNMSYFNFSISGLDLIQNYQNNDQTSQIIAFSLFLGVVIFGSMYLITLVALLSNSNVIFRFSLTTIILSAVICCAIGLVGKFFEMISIISTDTVASWLQYEFASVSPTVIDQVISTFLESYQITSQSFFIFLISLGLILLLILRRPYSKGLAYAHELDQSFGRLAANIDMTQIDIGQSATNIEENENNDENQAGNGATSALPQGAMAEMVLVDPCPAFSELDAMQNDLLSKKEYNKQYFPFENPTLPKLVQFIVQYARDSRLHLFYTAEDIATFIAGLGTTKLTILQGMSGTGKTSLPKIFSEALCSNCDIIEVESSWRDKNELLGYYNEFSKIYTPKKFTQALYKASLNPDTLTFIVLDEMNLSRIEYYFSDFLSLMENEPDKREIKLLNVGLFKSINEEKVPYNSLVSGHTIKIPSNVWFIGTANRDESTFEISDKVYDRAHTMNFNKRAKTVRCYNEPIPQGFISSTDFNLLLEEAKKTVDFSVENYPLIAEVEKLLEPYNISFGNRIAMQIESFVSIYCACFTPTEDVIKEAVERILLSKVVSKLELKSVENKVELASAFEDLNLLRCSEFILKLNED